MEDLHHIVVHTFMVLDEYCKFRIFYCWLICTVEVLLDGMLWGIATLLPYGQHVFHDWCLCVFVRVTGSL